MTGVDAGRATVLAAGAVISIFSVTLVVIYGQTRILFAMGRDGMIPPLFHKLNPRTLTPVPATIIVAVVISLLAGLLPIDFLAEMTSIGTLVAFLIVSIGVMVLRQTQPDLPRGFKVPLYPRDPDPLDRRLHLDHPGPARGDDLRLLRLGRGGAALVLLLRQAPLRARTGRRRARMTLARRLRPRRARAGRVLHLGGMLARSAGDDLVVCAVVPGPWSPSPARVDAEYRAYLTRPRRTALDEARERLPADVAATLLVHDARSAPAGLLEVAEQHDAALIVRRLVLGRRRSGT